MSEFDVNEAVDRIRVDPCEMVGLDGGLAEILAVNLRSKIRVELRAALLAGEVRGFQAGRVEEREACAQVAEDCSGGDGTISKRALIAARIRART